MINIQSLITTVADTFSFDDKTYPELKGVTEDYRLKFAVRHSALHMTKTTGKIAAVSEDVDHGTDMDVELLKKEVNKSIINILRLAEVLGMSGESVEKHIQATYDKYKT